MENNPLQTFIERKKNEFDEKFEHIINLDPKVGQSSLQISQKDFLQTFAHELVEFIGEGQIAVGENTSDGYHTFKELYEFRKMYNAALFNEWSAQGKYDVHKSERHGDGELAFGGGWFIVMATLPSGQISNHYEMKDWELFSCEIREKAEKWDGHTNKDVLLRLKTLNKP